ncbi:hypothetical protein C8F01DRAFT_139233 [Mycena amicta]|nr:hypothetical protein C8F01DRAFT_139233 [Mycena amicta]
MGRSVWPEFPSRYVKGEKWSTVARRVNITMDSDAAPALLVWDETLSSNNPSAFERAIARSSIRFPPCHVTSRHVTPPRPRLAQPAVPNPPGTHALQLDGHLSSPHPMLQAIPTAAKLQGGQPRLVVAGHPLDAEVICPRELTLMRIQRPFSFVWSLLWMVFSTERENFLPRGRCEQDCPSKIHRASSPSSLLLRVLPTGTLVTAVSSVSSFSLAGCTLPSSSSPSLATCANGRSYYPSAS